MIVLKLCLCSRRAMYRMCGWDYGVLLGTLCLVTGSSSLHKITWSHQHRFWADTVAISSRVIVFDSFQSLELAALLVFCKQ